MLWFASIAVMLSGSVQLAQQAATPQLNAMSVSERPLTSAVAEGPAIWLVSKPGMPAAHQSAAPDGERRSAHELWRAEDGLFYVDASVNGQTIRFLVDTGASMIVLTAEDAERAGVSPDRASFTRVAETAGGKSRMAGVTLAHMRVGETSASAVPAVVAGEGLGVSLLGQNWLSHLASVTIEGDRMVLR